MSLLWDVDVPPRLPELRRLSGQRPVAKRSAGGREGSPLAQCSRRPAGPPGRASLAFRRPLPALRSRRDFATLVCQVVSPGCRPPGPPEPPGLTAPTGDQRAPLSAFGPRGTVAPTHYRRPSVISGVYASAIVWYAVPASASPVLYVLAAPGRARGGCFWWVLRAPSVAPRFDRQSSFFRPAVSLRRASFLSAGSLAPAPTTPARARAARRPPPHSR